MTKAIQEQMEKDGTDHVWLSLENIDKETIKKSFSEYYERCLEEGYDVIKEWIPVVPAQHYFMGGIWVDSDSKTSMDHLYAVGETVAMVFMERTVWQVILFLRVWSLQNVRQKICNATYHRASRKCN